jgi:hypothetical protein
VIFAQEPIRASILIFTYIHPYIGIYLQQIRPDQGILFEWRIIYSVAAEALAAADLYLLIG